MVKRAKDKTCQTKGGEPWAPNQHAKISTRSSPHCSNDRPKSFAFQNVKDNQTSRTKAKSSHKYQVTGQVSQPSGKTHQTLSAPSSARPNRPETMAHHKA